MRRTGKEIIVDVHRDCDECEYKINAARDEAKRIGNERRARFDPDAPRSVFTPRVIVRYRD